jgi:hypothetical protein
MRETLGCAARVSLAAGAVQFSRSIDQTLQVPWMGKRSLGVTWPALKAKTSSSYSSISREELTLAPAGKEQTSVACSVMGLTVQISPVS